MNFEEFFPLILIALWGLQKLFSKKTKEAEETDPVLQEEEERTRELQEEILRKIRERHGEKTATQPPTNEGEVVPVHYETEESEKDTLEPAPFETPEPILPSYAEQLNRQIEELQKVQTRTKQLLRTTNAAAPPQKLSRPRLSKELIRSLRDPYASQKAILYLEILGPPLGQRGNTQNPPHIHF